MYTCMPTYKQTSGFCYDAGCKVLLFFKGAEHFIVVKYEVLVL
jgi:hypothetical protein